MAVVHQEAVVVEAVHQGVVAHTVVAAHIIEDPPTMAIGTIMAVLAIIVEEEVMGSLQLSALLLAVSLEDYVCVD